MLWQRILVRLSINCSETITANNYQCVEHSCNYHFQTWPKADELTALILNEVNC